jgi:hypothetical protein
VGVEGEADLVDVCAVDVYGGVELLAGDTELLGPIGDVGGHLGVDLFGVVGALGVGLGLGVSEDGVFGVGDVLDVAVAVMVHVGHWGGSSFLAAARWMSGRGLRMYLGWSDGGPLPPHPR